MTNKPTRTPEGKTATGAAGTDSTDRHGRLKAELRELITGMSVSIDVSTGDHDAGHRLFGVVNEVMDDDGDKCGVTLLVYETTANFATEQPSPATGGEPATDSAEREPLDVEFKRLADTILQATTNGTRLEALRGIAELFDKCAAREPAPVVRELRRCSKFGHRCNCAVDCDPSQPHPSVVAQGVARELDVEAERREFMEWFEREYPKNEEGNREKYRNTMVMDLMLSAYLAARRASPAPVGTEQAAGALGWISVTDQLPEDKQVVAFVVDTEDWERFRYMHGRVLGGMYTESDGHFSVPGLGLLASHWMPLPAAPSPHSPVGAKEQE